MGIEAQETVPAPPPRLLPTPQERAARESLTSTANNLEEGEGRTGGRGLPVPRIPGGSSRGLCRGPGPRPSLQEKWGAGGGSWDGS